jgi:Uma2 family endonuclease
MMTLARWRLTTFCVDVPLSVHADQPAAEPRVLPMGMPVPKVRYTVDDLDAMPEDGNRYEIINGKLFVTPAPRLWHQFALLELVERLGPFAKALDLRLLVAPTDVRSSDTTQVEPDLFVFPRLADIDGTTRWVAMHRLLLAVEILSRSTAKVDRGPKRELYLDHGIAEYWIVDVDARVVAIYTPDNPEPRVHGASMFWQPLQDRDGLFIDLVEYFDEVRG